MARLGPTWPDLGMGHSVQRWTTLCTPNDCPTLTLSSFGLRMSSVLHVVTQVPNLPAANAFGRETKEQAK